jgi:hypothetical protein
VATSLDQSVSVAQLEQGYRVRRRNPCRQPVRGREGGVGRRAPTSTIRQRPAEATDRQLAGRVT